ncbi:transketolase family protein [Clostridium sp. MT-14]|jgi:transketolase|uniref:Transketolase family protein n=1 Tax=Clostridium aromativorans TaxID=2836848 RepID=A0ABS8N7G3_9CLOT|nr:transketolase C-terminal domain-containing protein [Clostridium aromativorans]MCC9295748.1 transketolase family protein [Clostridium aromativorans]
MMTENKKSTRDAFIDGLLSVGEGNRKIVTVAADSQSRYGSFVNLYRERSFNVGIAEQSMIGIAAGLALAGKIPVVTSYANFLTFRACEQIRVDIAGQNLNVKIVGTDTGFSSEWLGYTHMALEDVASIRSIPNVVIIDPADYNEAFAATRAAFEYKGPVYLRLRGRKKENLVYDRIQDFQIGRGNVLRKGKDAVVISSGGAVYDSLKAVDLLRQNGINAALIDMASIRPLDDELILNFVSKIKTVVTVEDHNIVGGLGSAVAELLSENTRDTTLLRLGVKDSFGTAGTDEMLKKKFMLDTDGIASGIRSFIENHR